MQVIPVIDLKGGVVVHARGGDRSAYAPLNSPLAKGPDPVTVIEGFMRLHPFETLYVADLDGIMQGVPDLQTLHALREAFPDLDIWLDNGMSDAGVVGEQLQNLARVRPVIGTESLRHVDDFIVLSGSVEKATGHTPILSLDFKGGEMLGADLMGRPEAWPDTVIVMTLDAVGVRGGPDVSHIGKVRACAPSQSRIVAAGGVRDKSDLVSLVAAGANAALVATALHAGTLKAGDLVEVAGLQTGP